MLRTTLLLAVTGLALGGLLPPHQLSAEHSLQQQFQQFKQLFNKVYKTSEEELERFAIFKDNLAFIAQHNARHEAGETTFKVGVNQFADMTNEQFQQWLGEAQEPQSGPNALPFVSRKNAVSLPATVDWRNEDYVTAVKDQGQCGSCWSFSSTGSMEGQHKNATGKLVSLSEQNLVDCSGRYGNEGCNGGWPYQAFEYVIANKGVDTENSYPYKGVQGSCHYSTSNLGATISKYHELQKGSESQLQEAVADVGPVSICIDASHMSFQLYTSGVYDEPKCSSTRLDHAVLAAGYGTDSGTPYWLVKNSWSTSWGEAGYIKMSRNKNNQCGIATAAVYPLV